MNSFQSEKSSVKVSAVPKLTVSLKEAASYVKTDSHKNQKLDAVSGEKFM